MKVTNSTSYKLIAFGWHTQRGYGDDVAIPAGETAEVNGPYLGEMGGGACHVALGGEIVCQQTPDDNLGFQVVQGYMLNLASGEKGICVRHYADEPEPKVLGWRAHNSAG